MAWNPSPKVAAARDIGNRFNKEQVIVLMIDLKAGTLELATYGKTKELCKSAGELGDAAYASVMAKFADKAVDATDDGCCPCGSGCFLGVCPQCGREIGRVL